jgi:hypothetical protein
LLPVSSTGTRKMPLIEPTLADTHEAAAKMLMGKWLVAGRTRRASTHIGNHGGDRRSTHNDFETETVSD